MPDLQAAIALARSGDHLAARRLLAQIVRAEPANEMAWLWLAGVLDTPAERRQALQTCLRFNPAAAQARRALEALEKQAAIAQTVENESLPSQPAAAPAATQEAAPPEIFAPTAGPRPPEVESTPPKTPLPPDPRPFIEDAAPRQGTSRGLLLGGLLLFGSIVCVIVIALASGILRPPALGTPTDAPLYPQNDPVQFNLALNELPAVEVGDWGYTWTLTPRARYQVTARILSIHDYSYNLLDNRARLAPYDFALGWGRMSDPMADQWITWSQSGRWYFYYLPSPQAPYTLNEVAQHSSNHHLIPATDNLRGALRLAEPNDIIFLEGLLVDAQTILYGTDFRAPTSLSREDIGDGACEALYIQRLVLHGIEYK